MTNVVRRTPDLAKVYQFEFRYATPQAANLLGVKIYWMG